MDLIDFVAKSFSGLQLQCILGGSDDSTCSVYITDAPIVYCSSFIDQHDTHTYIYNLCSDTLYIPLSRNSKTYRGTPRKQRRGLPILSHRGTFNATDFSSHGNARWEAPLRHQPLSDRQTLARELLLDRNGNPHATPHGHTEYGTH